MARTKQTARQQPGQAPPQKEDAAKAQRKLTPKMGGVKKPPPISKRIRDLKYELFTISAAMKKKKKKLLKLIKKRRRQRNEEKEKKEKQIMLLFGSDSEDTEI